MEYKCIAWQSLLIPTDQEECQMNEGELFTPVYSRSEASLQNVELVNNMQGDQYGASGTLLPFTTAISGSFSTRLTWSHFCHKFF